MIGRLDRYVLKTALGSYVAGLFFIMGMFILLHLLTRIGEYTGKAAEAGTGTGELLWLILQHYAYFAPIVFVMVAPFVSVIAGMFAVARLMSDNEIAPMIFTGRSTVRCLAPIILLAVVSGCAMVAAWEFVVPKCSEPLTVTKGILRGKIDGRDPRLTLSNLLVKQRDAEDGTRIDLNIRSYDHVAQRANGLKLLDETDGPQGAVVVDAAAAVWVPERGDWALEGGWRTSSAAGGARSRQEWLGLDGVTPELLFRIGKEDRETV
ncbi:MAG: LptF/LptG family permease, partial [Planctomycetota bacterium]